MTNFYIAKDEPLRTCPLRPGSPFLYHRNTWAVPVASETTSEHRFLISLEPHQRGGQPDEARLFEISNASPVCLLQRLRFDILLVDSQGHLFKMDAVTGKCECVGDFKEPVCGLAVDEGTRRVRVVVVADDAIVVLNERMEVISRRSLVGQAGTHADIVWASDGCLVLMSGAVGGCSMAVFYSEEAEVTANFPPGISCAAFIRKYNRFACVCERSVIFIEPNGLALPGTTLILDPYLEAGEDITGVISFEKGTHTLLVLKTVYKGKSNSLVFHFNNFVWYLKLRIEGEVLGVEEEGLVVRMERAISLKELSKTIESNQSSGDAVATHAEEQRENLQDKKDLTKLRSKERSEADAVASQRGDVNNIESGVSTSSSVNCTAINDEDCGGHQNLPESHEPARRLKELQAIRRPLIKPLSGSATQWRRLTIEEKEDMHFVLDGKRVYQSDLLSKRLPQPFSASELKFDGFVEAIAQVGQDRPGNMVVYACVAKNSAMSSFLLRFTCSEKGDTLSVDSPAVLPLVATPDWRSCLPEELQRIAGHTDIEHASEMYRTPCSAILIHSDFVLLQRPNYLLIAHREQPLCSGWLFMPGLLKIAVDNGWYREEAKEGSAGIEGEHLLLKCDFNKEAEKCTAHLTLALLFSNGTVLCNDKKYTLQEWNSSSTASPFIFLNCATVYAFKDNCAWTIAHSCKTIKRNARMNPIPTENAPKNTRTSTNLLDHASISTTATSITPSPTPFTITSALLHQTPSNLFLIFTESNAVSIASLNPLTIRERHYADPHQHITAIADTQIITATRFGSHETFYSKTLAADFLSALLSAQKYKEAADLTDQLCLSYAAFFPPPHQSCPLRIITEGLLSPRQCVALLSEFNFPETAFVEDETIEILRKIYRGKAAATSPVQKAVASSNLFDPNFMLIRRKGGPRINLSEALLQINEDPHVCLLPADPFARHSSPFRLSEEGEEILERPGQAVEKPNRASHSSCINKDLDSEMLCINSPSQALACIFTSLSPENPSNLIVLVNLLISLKRPDLVFRLSDSEKAVQILLERLSKDEVLAAALRSGVPAGIRRALRVCQMEEAEIRGVIGEGDGVSCAVLREIFNLLEDPQNVLYFMLKEREMAFGRCIKSAGDQNDVIEDISLKPSIKTTDGGEQREIEAFVEKHSLYEDLLIYEYFRVFTGAFCEWVGAHATHEARYWLFRGAGADERAERVALDNLLWEAALFGEELKDGCAYALHKKDCGFSVTPLDATPESSQSNRLEANALNRKRLAEGFVLLLEAKERHAAAAVLKEEILEDSCGAFQSYLRAQMFQQAFRLLKKIKEAQKSAPSAVQITDQKILIDDVIADLCAALTGAATATTDALHKQTAELSHLKNRLEKTRLKLESNLGDSQTTSRSSAKSIRNALLKDRPGGLFEHEFILNKIRESILSVKCLKEKMKDAAATLSAMKDSSVNFNDFNNAFSSYSESSSLLLKRFQSAIATAKAIVKEFTALGWDYKRPDWESNFPVVERPSEESEELKDSDFSEASKNFN